MSGFFNGNGEASPLLSPAASSSSRLGEQKRSFKLDESKGPFIFLKAKKNTSESIVAATKELRKRGFAVAIEQEVKKDGSCNFLLYLSPVLINKIAVHKKYPGQRPLYMYTELQQLIILNTAIENLLESCVFLEGREAWIAQDPEKFNALKKEKDIPKKLLLINSYFGPEVGLYFGWLDHYYHQLLIPSILGILVFAHQYYYNDIDSIWMPFYAIFIVLWTTVFLELSKQNISKLSFTFGVLGQEEEQEADSKSKEFVEASKRESYLRPFRLSFSFAVVLLLIYILVEIMLISVDRQIRAEEIYGKEGYWKYMPQVVYSLVPIVASTVFQPIAEYLTDFEHHLIEVCDIDINVVLKSPQCARHSGGT